MAVAAMIEIFSTCFLVIPEKLWKTEGAVLTYFIVLPWHLSGWIKESRVKPQSK
jgi:hypothetical protein